MGIQRLSHADLRVNNLADAIDFHVSALGLAELAREKGKVYFGCGPGDSYDVALSEGGTGVEMFALSADSEEDLVDLARRLGEAGVRSESKSDPSPGVMSALEFKLPAGHTVQLVLIKERVHYAYPARRTEHRTAAGAPIDIDHITLRAGEYTQATMDFMREMLGFYSSDIVTAQDGNTVATWMHVSDYHHDVAMFRGHAGETLDHLAWQMGSIDHIKLALDRFARDGLEIEAGPGRHNIGSNLYAYLWTPGGNRYELSAEMPRATDKRAPARRWQDHEIVKGFSSWNAPFPESFHRGS